MTTPAQQQTHIVFYKSEAKMQRGIRKLQKDGWTVVDTEVVEHKYGCCSIGCFWMLLVPLSWLGWKPRRYKVQFSREVSTPTDQAQL